MKPRLESSARTAIRWLAATTASCAFALPLAAGDEPAAPAPTPPAAAPAQDMDGNPALDITPTAGAWRDRLRNARRKVLDATARLDEINAEYARALYENPDDEKRVKSLAARRAHAETQLGEARAAIPPMVEAARKDGVSERVLELYEQATLD